MNNILMEYINREQPEEFTYTYLFDDKKEVARFIFIGLIKEMAVVLEKRISWRKNSPFGKVFPLAIPQTGIYCFIPRMIIVTETDVSHYFIPSLYRRSRSSYLELITDIISSA